MIAVRVRDLHYSYPDGTKALSGVSFDLEEGRSLFLMGSNGSGKTTLILHMNGILHPSRGFVEIFGIRVTKDRSVLAKVRRLVGLVFQDPDDQLFSPTIYEDIAFGPRNMGLPESEVRARVMDALEKVGLRGLENKAPHRLSEGQKKRAALATVLAMDPKILVLDEPTSNLDGRGFSSIVRILRELKEEGKTLIVATHDLELARRLADEILILNSGRVLAHAPANDILSQRKLLIDSGILPDV